MSAKRSVVCTYCSTEIATSKDHIPGKAFFPLPVPVDLITVPACQKCHGETKLDEDYFRQIATMQSDSNGAGRAVWETKTRRAIKKDLGLRKAIIPQIEPVDILTSAGIFVRRGYGLRIDWPRVDRFVEKCVRALFYFETKRRLPPTAVIQPRYFEDGDEMLNVVVQSTGHGRRRWPDVFDYRRAIDQSDPYVSLWAIRFYRGMAFGISTNSNSENKYVRSEQ